MNLTLTPDATSVLANIDLGDPTPDGSGYFNDGDLAVSAGNLYLHIDGEEVGSLFFLADSAGQVTVTLGYFDVDQGDWIPAGTVGGQSDPSAGADTRTADAGACDLADVLAQIDDWEDERIQLSAQEEVPGAQPRPDDWHRNDDRATELLRMLAGSVRLSPTDAQS